MKHEPLHDIIDSANCLDREAIIEILDRTGYGFDDDESTISLRQKLISDITAGIIPKSIMAC